MARNKKAKSITQPIQKPTLDRFLDLLYVDPKNEPETKFALTEHVSKMIGIIIGALSTGNKSLDRKIRACLKSPEKYRRVVCIRRYWARYAVADGIPESVVKNLVRELNKRIKLRFSSDDGKTTYKFAHRKNTNEVVIGPWSTAPIFTGQLPNPIWING